jgi:hypothetical protein
MFALDMNRKRDTAATIPGWSGHEMTSLKSRGSVKRSAR